nr:unnamed protein product [Callosobruchus chinensis]
MTVIKSQHFIFCALMKSTLK